MWSDRELFSLLESLLVSDVVAWLHYLLYFILISGFFSNSFVVNEDSLVAFCVATSALLHAYNVLVKSEQETNRSWHLVLTLLLLGLLRLVP